jgi:hypothetical protein
VPIPRNYYFDAEAPIGTVVSGMRQVLALHGVHGDGGGPQLGTVEEGLAEAEAGLAAALGDGASFAELRDAYERFRGARVALGSRIAGWPAEAVALAGDHAYEQAPRELGANGALPPELEGDVRRYIENEWRTWRNTNVRKYLELRRQAVPG